jgi:hypothetical protein
MTIDLFRPALPIILFIGANSAVRFPVQDVALPPKADMCSATRDVAMGQRRTWRQPQWQNGPPLSSSAMQHTAEMCQKGQSLACHATAELTVLSERLSGGEAKRTRSHR